MTLRLALVFGLALVCGTDGAAARTGLVSPVQTAPQIIPVYEYDEVLTDAAANVVVGQLGDAADYCKWAGSQYAVDCLADQYQQIARSLPRSGDYTVVRDVLIETATAMSKIARSGALGPAVALPLPEPGVFRARAGRALIPARARVRSPARNILDQATTVLLRSASSAGQRRAAFTRIAEALGSNKILLRG